MDTLDPTVLLRYRFALLEPAETEAVTEALRTNAKCAAQYAALCVRLDALAQSPLPEGPSAQTLARCQSRVRALVDFEAAAAAQADSARALAEAQPSGCSSSGLDGGDGGQRQPVGWLAACGLRGGAEFRFVRLLCTLTVLAALGYLGYGAYCFGGDGPALDTRVTGEADLLPGSPAVLRVEVTDRKAHAPVPHAKVRIDLGRSDVVRSTPPRGQEGAPLPGLPARPAAFSPEPSLPGSDATYTLFEGKTNGRGVVDAHLSIPDIDDGPYELTTYVRTDLEDDRVVYPVRFHRAYQIHLSTDKPLYKPGQVLHIRTMVLERPQLKPTGRGAVLVQVFDPRGNRLERRELQLSRFGIGACDVELSEDAPNGAYRVVAALRDAVKEQEIRVDRYSLPKFKVSVKTEKAFYLPGEEVRAEIGARYFFGESVDGGEVRALLVAENGDVVGPPLTQRTDKTGAAHLLFTVPTTLAPGAEPIPLSLDVSVTDRAGQKERREEQLLVARELLQIEVIPEAGELIADMENTLFVLTRTPDGKPVAARVRVTLPEGTKLHLKTQDNGIGDFRYLPSTKLLGLGPAAAQRGVRFSVEVEDESGARGQRTVDLGGRFARLLITTGRAFYLPQDTLQVGIQTISQYSAAIVEGIQDRQTMFRLEVPLSEGKGTAAIDIPPGVLGTLRLDVQAVDPYGVVSETVSRKVVVSRRDRLKVALTTAEPSFRPGSAARLTLRVTDEKGRPEMAAVGLAVVDESLLSMATQNPDLVLPSILLERALLQSERGLLGASAFASEPWRDGDQLAGRLLLSLHRDGPKPERFAENTFEKKLALRKEAQADFMARAPLAAFAALSVLTLAAVVWLARRRPPWASGVLIALLAGAGLGSGFRPELVLALVAGCAISGIAVHLQRAQKQVWPLLVLPALAGGAAYFALGDSPGLLAPAITAPADSAPPLAGPAEPLRPDRNDRRLKDELARKGVSPGSAPQPAASAAESGGAEKATAESADRARRAESAPAPARAASTGARDNSGSGGAAIGGLGQAARAQAGALAAPAPVQRAVRIRRYFPETMYYNAELITNEGGEATLTIPLADSITDWRIAALASAKSGRLGALTQPLKVFQEFFVDVDLPVALVQGDEAAIPVAVYNYLSVPQNVRLEVLPAPWFQLLGAPVLALSLPGMGVDGRELRIRVTSPGHHRITLRADGSHHSDALERQLDVVPTGQPRFESASGIALANETVRGRVEIPAAAVLSSAQILVKLFPTTLSTALNGLEGQLREPNGCFEQTTSTAYPNIYIYQLLKAHKQLTPAFEQHVRRTIALGHQRVLRFEVKHGGFSWFGQAPAELLHSAYALMALSDMRQVFPVDENVIARTRAFIAEKQRRDGTWDSGADPALRERTAAFVAFALAESGLRGTEMVRAAEFLRRQLAAQTDDPYLVALALATFVKAGFPEHIDSAAQTLARLAQKNGTEVSFVPEGVIPFGSQGETAVVATTALAAYALHLAKREPALVDGALGTLVKLRAPGGAWGSSQATVLALRALLSTAGRDGRASVRLKVNGADAGVHKLKGTEDQPLVVPINGRVQHGANLLELVSDAKTSYQMVASYTLPWPKTPQDDSAPMALSVSYGRSRVQVGGVVPVAVDLLYRTPRPSGMVLVNLGVPAGLEPVREQLEQLMREQRIARYEVGSTAVHLYLLDLPPGRTLAFHLGLKARTRVKTSGAPSLAYLYYSPEIRGIAAPTPLTVY